MEESPNAFLIFLRMPKTGSTTLKSIVLSELSDARVFVASDHIFDVYGREWKDYPDEERWRVAYDAFRAFPPEKVASYDAFVGHTWYGVHENLPGPARYVTFLRDPVKRFVSLYNYFYDKRGHWLSEEIHRRTLSFSEFLDDRDLCAPWENQQVKMISGERDADEESLRNAFRILEEDFLFVGLTKHFDTDLVRLAHRLNWGPPLYTRKNASRKHVRLSDLSDRCVGKIVSRNRLDIALYRYVEALRPASSFENEKVQQFKFKLRNSFTRLLP